MQYVLEVLLIFIIFLSTVPFVQMFKNRNDSKYACLRFLIYLSFIWTILIVIERLISYTQVVYYAGMLGFPIRLGFSFLIMCTIFQYVEMKLPKLAIYGMILFTIADFAIAITNSKTGWFLDLSVNELNTYQNLYDAFYGPLFVYHLVLSYMVALSAIVLLFVFLAKRRSVRQYKAVTQMMALSIIIVLLFNSLQLFVIDTSVNLTYISLIIVAYTLYEIIYKRDMIFNLRVSGRSEILANMRELYIIADMDKRIIEVSPLLLDKYDIKIDEIRGHFLDQLVERLSSVAVFYTDYDKVDEQQVNKDHYHLREKEFRLKGMRESGYMILLYDETQVYQLLRDLNRLSNYDAMTGLHNRNFVEHKFESFGLTHETAVYSIDLNGLKINNDYLGHERGDYLLKHIAIKMKQTFEDVAHTDMARIGGDEFIIIVQRISKKDAEDKMDNLLKRCFDTSMEKKISISIGLSYNTNKDISIYDLIREADQAMYKMKEKTSPIYHEEMIEFIKLQGKFIR